MSHNKKLIATIMLYASLIGNAYAQDSSDSSIENDVQTEVQTAEPVGTQAKAQELKRWSGSIGLSYFALNEEAAESQNIGENAVSFDLAGSYYFSSRLKAVLGLGLITLDDEAQFSQTVNVVGIFGSDTETLSSDASAFQVYSEALYATPPVSSLALQFRAGVGYGAIVSADRSIDNCSDCREEDIDLEGGAYVRGGVFKATRSDKVNIGFSMRKYFSSDFDFSAMISLEYFL